MPSTMRTSHARPRTSCACLSSPPTSATGVTLTHPANSATKGIGRTQPTEWQDAGAALENAALKGCRMPKGPGRDVSDQQAYLQYNEVR